MVSVTLNVHSLQHFFRSKGRCLESYILLYRIELFHGRVSQRLVLTKIYEIRSPFLCVPSTYEVEHVARQWTALNFQRKGRCKCLRWFLFAFRDKQTTDWLRDVSEYFQFEGVSPGSWTFQSTLGGWGGRRVFLTATVEGLVRLNGEGDCINWKDFLDWIMFDNLYYFNRGRTIWSGGKGRGSGAVYGWFGLGKKIFSLNLYLVIEFFADTQRCEIFFSAL